MQRIPCTHEARRAALTASLDDVYGLLSADPREPTAVPPDGEAWLVYHPTPEGTVGFGVTASGVVASPPFAISRELPAAALAAGLLAPLAGALEGVRRVRVLALGPAEGVDLHALPHCGGVLGGCVEVVYGLDVSPTVAPGSAAGRRLVVTDPTGDLPQARAEADGVVAALQQPVTELRGASASRQAVRDGLDGAAVFHYAGHARYAGRAGWESALPLADYRALTVGDVLALEAAPRLVVLSACEAAQGEALGMGLAQAFIAAGASAVVAPARPVPDEVAREMSVTLHRYLSDHGGGSPGDELIAAFHAAQRELAQKSEPSSYFSYRILVP